MAVYALVRVVRDPDRADLDGLRRSCVLDMLRALKLAVCDRYEALKRIDRREYS